MTIVSTTNTICLRHVRASSILPRQSGPPPAFGGADLGVDLQKKSSQLKRPQPGRHHCLEMMSILTANAPQIMARASNCGAHAIFIGFVIMLLRLYAFQQKMLKFERLFEEHI